MTPRKVIFSRYKENVPRELTDFTRKEGHIVISQGYPATKQSSFVNLDQSIRAPENMKAT
jgi:hypothetical protein